MEHGGAAVIKLKKVKVIIFGSWSCEQQQENGKYQTFAETIKRVEGVADHLRKHGF
jgi:hypothetical protein